MKRSSLQLGQAFSLIMRTLPIAALRLGAYVAFWVVTLIYLGIVGGIAFLVGQAVPWLGVILFLVALVGLAPLYNLAKRYVLYVIKAAHIAVLAELLASGSLPPGTSQLAWGKQRVRARFGEVSVMFVVDELVAAVVRGITRAIYSIASWLPGNTLRTLAGMANRVIYYAVSYVDEAILARAFWLDQGPVWATARDGVVLYGMIWKALLLNAVVLMVLSYIPFILVLIILSAPVGALLNTIAPRSPAGASSPRSSSPGWSKCRWGMLLPWPRSSPPTTMRRAKCSRIRRSRPSSNRSAASSTCCSSARRRNWASWGLAGAAGPGAHGAGELSIGWCIDTRGISRTIYTEIYIAIRGML